MAHDCYITCCDMKRYVKCLPVAHIYLYPVCSYWARWCVVLLLPIYTYTIYVELLTAVYLSIMFYNQSAFHFDIIILSTIYMRSVLLIDPPINHRSSRARHTRKLLFWMIIRLGWIYTFFSLLLMHNHIKRSALASGYKDEKQQPPQHFKAYELISCDVFVCK